MTGITNSPNFPTTAGSYDTSSISLDAFVTKVNPEGSALVYSTYLGGSDSDGGGRGIAVDASGNVYVTGGAAGNDFPTTAGAFDTSANGAEDGFVTKLNAAGSALVYSTYLGGSARDEPYDIAIDADGNAYVTGWTGSANFPTTDGAVDTTYGGGFDAFVTKVNPAGSALVYSTYIGGSNTDQGWGNRPGTQRRTSVHYWCYAVK